MKKVVFLTSVLLTSVLVLSSCKKEECHECHYEDASGAKVEIGEKCGSELENAEASGVNVNGTNYEVHCHDH